MFASRIPRNAFDIRLLGKSSFSQFARLNTDLLLDYDLQEQSGSVAHAWNVGVALGRDVVINGDFANWTGVAPADTPDDWNVSFQDANTFVTDATNACRMVSDGTSIFIDQDMLEASKDYQATIIITDASSGGIVVGQAGEPSTQTTLTTVDTHIHNFTAVDSDNFVVARSGVTDITFTVSIKQRNILVSTSYPFPEELDNGDFTAWSGSFPNEIATGWTDTGAARSATVHTTENPSGHLQFVTDAAFGIRQTKLTIGIHYQFIGVCTAVAAGSLQIGTSTDPNVAGIIGSTGTFVFEFIADGTIFQMTSFVATDITFSLVSIKPANPLNADITGMVLGVPTGLPLGYAMTGDGATTYISLLNALTELNSIINMQKGSLAAYINPTALGSNKVIFTLYIDANNWIKAYTDTGSTVTVEYRGAGTTSSVQIAGVVTGQMQQIFLTWDTTAAAGAGEFIAYLDDTKSGSTQVIADEIVGNLTKAIMFADSDTPTLVFNGSGSQTIKLYVDAQSASVIADLARRAGVA